jgi:SAM-dependent methyltransferase
MESIVCGLESPCFHRVRWGARNRFSGFAVELRGEPIAAIEARIGARGLARHAVDLPSPDLEQHLPQVTSASRCRFDFELELPAAVTEIELRAVYPSGRQAELFVYPGAEVQVLHPWLASLAAGLEALPQPDGQLIFATQGGRNQAHYTDSIVSAIFHLRRYLEAAGIGIDAPRAILDFGCGTGRVLAGWYLHDPQRRLEGCDLNPELIDWARGHLPAALRFEVNGMEPPLPYADQTLDLILAVSVFTHLRLDRQRAWAREFGRLLRPGGHLLVTLHGPLYALALGGESELAELARRGYLESPEGREGANAFTTLHAPAFANGYLEGFTVAAHFPEGRLGGHRPIFPLASFQDVYLYHQAAGEPRG